MARITRQDMLEAISARWLKSSSQYSIRDSNLAEQFRAYDGTFWEHPKASVYEQRTTVRLVADNVEMDAAILLSKPPVITVPPSSVSGIGPQEAAILENALYAVWDMMGLFGHWCDVIWFASLTGWGIMRGPIYSPHRKPFPMIAYACDPRCCYPSFDAVGDLRWHFYSQYRTVGDVRSELPKVTGRLWRPDILPEDEDAVVVWTEYFGWHDDRLYHAIFVDQRSDAQTGQAPASLPKTGSARSFPIATTASVLKWPEDITHIYPRIPFFYVFPRHVPRSEPGEEGRGVADRVFELQKALSSILTIILTDTILRAAPPVWGDGTIVAPKDATGAYIDTSPGGYTQVSPPGSKIQPLPSSISNADIAHLWDTITVLAGRSTLPPSMFGQYEAAMSGLALSVLNNPALIKVAKPQFHLARAMQSFNSALLLQIHRLPPTLAFRGYSRTGAAFEFTRSDIPETDYTYNVVSLSAGLPRDIPAAVGSLIQARQVDSLSARTVIEQLQNYLDLPSKDAEREWDRLAEEKIMLAKQSVDVAAAVQAYQMLQQTGLRDKIQAPGVVPPTAEGNTPPQPLNPQGLPATVTPPQQQAVGPERRLGLERAGIRRNLMPGPITGTMGGAQR